MTSVGSSFSSQPFAIKLQKTWATEAGGVTARGGRAGPALPLSPTGQQGPWRRPIARGLVAMATSAQHSGVPGVPAAGAPGTMARNLYGPRVRMGNWNEDVYLEEVREARRRGRGAGPPLSIPHLLSLPAHAGRPGISPAVPGLGLSPLPLGPSASPRWVPWLSQAPHLSLPLSLQPHEVPSGR